MLADVIQELAIALPEAAFSVVKTITACRQRRGLHANIGDVSMLVSNRSLAR